MKRQTWTKQTNENVIKCHFKAIFETRTTYRKDLHQNWKNIYTDSTLTEQHLSDQKRQINEHAKGILKNKNWLTQSEIELFEQEAYIFYGNDNTNIEIQKQTNPVIEKSTE